MLFDFGKGKAEKKTKQTQKAITAVQSRVALMGGTGGGTPGASSGKKHQLAAQDIALYPDPKKGVPRTSNVGNYR